MRVELRNHPSQAVRESRTPSGQQIIEPKFDEDGAPVPLFPDQYGIYFQLDTSKGFRCVGYCMKDISKPINITETFLPHITEYILREAQSLREVAQRSEHAESLAEEFTDASRIEGAPSTGGE